MPLAFLDSAKTTVLLVEMATLNLAVAGEMVSPSVPSTVESGSAPKASTVLWPSHVHTQLGAVHQTEVFRGVAEAS